MPTSAPGSSRGFTLLELMVVLAVIAVAVGLVSLAIRDPAQSRLENEAARLSALLEGARTEARAAGLAAFWVPSPDPRGEPFRFVGLPAALNLPTRWLDDRVSAQVVGGTRLVLGPEPILPAQRVALQLEARRIEIGSDGLAPFAVLTPNEPAP